MSRDTNNLATLCAAVLVAVLAVLSIVGLPTRKETVEPETAAAPAASDDDADEGATEEEQPAKDEPDPAQAERDHFVAVWAERIDAFNAGYPLEGYGAAFAGAAYDYGVDPRYSPAIARVESGSGTNCAYSCNAWGWGSSSWPDWETAIYAHVAGLAESYGYSLSYEGAMRYNSETPDEWYAQVESCLYQIWESDSL